MKAITKYQANDGAEFKTAEECEKHEVLVARIDEIMSQLPPTPKDDGCRFANGHGYIQHDPLTFIKVRNELLDLGAEQFSDGFSYKSWFAETKAGTRHNSWVGRLLDDNGVRPLSRAWYRIMATDELAREWGQIYYALNPGKGEEIQLN
jgi:hypothetical protein